MIPYLISARRSGIVAHNDPTVNEILKSLNGLTETPSKKKRVKKEPTVADSDYLFAKQLQDELCRRSSRSRGAST